MLDKSRLWKGATRLCAQRQPDLEMDAAWKMRFKQSQSVSATRMRGLQVEKNNGGGRRKSINFPSRELGKQKMVLPVDPGVDKKRLLLGLSGS